jgi:hypothetical protein
MKKTTVVILLACYLAASAGVIVNYHYCMNKLASAKLYEKKSKKCGKCGMHTKDSNGCCRDEVKVVKMEDDQKVTPAFTYDFSLLEAPVQLPSAFIIAAFHNAPLPRHYQNHSPPLLSQQDTYIQNSVFRI